MSTRSIDRQPLMLSSISYKPEQVIHWYDHDASRYEIVGNTAIAYTTQAQTRQPKVWRVRLLAPNAHGNLCQVGVITNQTGLYYLHMWPNRFDDQLGTVRITRIKSEGQALDFARGILPVLFP